jgi:NADH-quinone oxidoreductase subunit A
VHALLSIVLFVLGGLALGLVGLGAGRLIRPKNPHPDKGEAYECGELPIGGAHVQFDLRFYIVALIYLVFAVEVVLFYPWAVAYGSADQMAEPFTTRAVALVDMLVFFALIVVGFAYLWRFGYLDWIRSEPRGRT